ncbi:M12 family metallo-peptidase [Pseudoalteromonas sp. T1lg23B]|uniref:M12 family metallo-peptidase n=1 Tax=Pseudoalteromonas sp. T1lg23B TaxID=2077097 RepID=UPI000CF62B12|nr:M12 family metallo-peptidase [Pseudoalteromonas sp. T1lg23B]
MKLLTKSKVAKLCGCVGIALSSASYAANNGVAQTTLPIQAIENLPNGKLKTSLSKLPPHAQQKALVQLNELAIPAIDTLLMQADSSGELFYIEEGLVETTSPDSEEAYTLPPVDVFKLHSNEHSNNKVFLDFDGGTVSNRAWGSGSSYDSVPYDLDGDPTTFNDNERARIHEIWNRMADDFAAFDIDVTTEAPVEFGPNVGWVLFTKDTDLSGKAMPHQGAGGVAYVNVWGRSNFSYYQPAFVYYNRLGAGVATYMAEAGSHELGHNLGLSHDGTSTQSYYAGLGSDSEPSSWAPIMGVSYYKNVTQWSKGEYPDANQTQDDIAIIATKLGMTLDTEGSADNPVILNVDSHGVFSATNRQIDPDNVSTYNKGSVQVSDSDWFQFSVGAGPAEFIATPAWDAFTRSSKRGANLDIGLRLYDGNGTLINTSNEYSNTNAHIQIDLAQGVYTLEVFGAEGPYASDYASQGHFYLQGQVTPATPDNTPPDPNPMSFAQAPTGVSDSQIAMQAVSAMDDNGGVVSYRFNCTQNGNVCQGSDWQSDTQFTATSLQPQTQYCFSVQAKDLSANTTLPSASLCATTQTPPPAPLPPNPASNLSVQDGQDGTAQLTWQDNSDNEQRFEIQRESQHKNGRWQANQIIASVNADDTAYTDYSDKGVFRYRVRAINEVAASDWTSWLSVTVTNSGDGGTDKPCKGKKCSN